MDVSEVMNTFLNLWPDDVEITKGQINKMQNTIIRSHQELVRETVEMTLDAVDRYTEEVQTTHVNRDRIKQLLKQLQVNK